MCFLFCDDIVLWLNRGAAAVTTVVILWSESQSGVVSSQSPTPYMYIHTPTCVHIYTIHNTLFSVGVDDLTHRHVQVRIGDCYKQISGATGSLCSTNSIIFSMYLNRFCHLFYLLE